VTIVFAALALALMAFGKVPLLVVLFTLAPLSIMAAALLPAGGR
jgi:hypothetical protein